MFPQKLYSVLFVAISLAASLKPFSLHAQVDSMHGPFDQIYALYSGLVSIDTVAGKVYDGPRIQTVVC